MRTHEKLFIGGEWVAPAGTNTIDVISPHSEELVGRVPEGTEVDIDRAVAAARDAFDHGDWSRMDPAERAAIVQNFSNVYAGQMMEMAAIVTEEMGSPITFSQLAQSPAPWLMLNAFLQIAAEYPWEERRAGVLGGDVIVRHEGVGVVGAIVPWNVPQFVTMSKLAPALLAGCSIVIKPSPETPLDAFFMAELLEEAGVPEGRRQHRARRSRGRRAPRAPPRRRQDRVHRFDGRPVARSPASAASSSSAAASSSAASRPRSSSTTPTSPPRSRA